MGLAGFQPERVRVDYKGRALTEVRGLSLDDVSLLVRSELPRLEQFYAALRDTAGDNLFAKLGEDGFMLRLVIDAPQIAASVIALASDEPTAEGEAGARRLPMPLQVKVLQTVMRLTFEDVGGPKAFVALVGEMVNQQGQPAGMLATAPLRHSTGINGSP